MLRKVLMLLLVTFGLAWTAAVQAAPIAFSYTDYYAYAYTQNTGNGEVDVDAASQSTPPISALAQKGNASADASGGIDKFLFAEAAESGKNELAQSWVHADLRFTATTDQVRLKFDYHLEVFSTGDATAGAQLYLYLDDLWSRDNISLSASSQGSLGDQVVSDTTTKSVNKVLSVTPGQDYQLWLEIWWVYAEGYKDSSAYAQAWIDNFSLDDGTTIITTSPPAHAPLPPTWLLLSSGLAVLQGWRRRREG